MNPIFFHYIKDEEIKEIGTIDHDGVSLALVHNYQGVSQWCSGT